MKRNYTMEVNGGAHATVQHAPSKHAPMIARDRTRIIGCMCGWHTPPGSTNSDDAYAWHAAVSLRWLRGGMR